VDTRALAGSRYDRELPIGGMARVPLEAKYGAGRCDGRVRRLARPALARVWVRSAAGKTDTFTSRWLTPTSIWTRCCGRTVSGNDDWRDLLKAASVRDARLHDGRHTAGTLLIEMGVHVRTVQEILGHSDIRVTQRYTHVSSAVAKDAAERMGRALWGGEPD
jgi:integrase